MTEKILLARHICLLALAVTCVYTDMARGKLYNSVTISGLCLGLALAFWLDATADGLPHLKEALVAMLAGGGLLFALYLVGGLGAGDVKFMAAVGALGGSWRFVLLALVYTALIGAAIALGTLIWQRRLFTGLKSSARALFTFRVKQREGARSVTIPYGIAIGIGTLWAWLEMMVLR